jgi:Tfp pilus assembly major pilin PilA
MRDISSRVKLPYVKGGVYLALYQYLALWWRSPVWPRVMVVIAVVTILALLLAFHHVVQGVVERAEVTRKAMAQHAQARRHCNNLPGRQAREGCLLDLNMQANGSREPDASVVVAGKQIEIR